MSIKDWSTNPAENNATPPAGWPEGMAPDQVNDTARQGRADIREFYNLTEWRDWGHTYSYVSGTSFSTDAADGDTTNVYVVGRRIRAVGSGTGTIYGAISSANHTTFTTVTVAWDSGALQSETLAISVGLDDTGSPVAGIEKVPTGTLRLTLQTTAAPGWVAMWIPGGSIGNAASGGTARADADTVNLFVYLYDLFASLEVQDQSGTPVPRGASAAADYAANRRLVLPDYQSRVLGLAGNGQGLSPQPFGSVTGAESPTHNLSSVQTSATAGAGLVLNDQTGPVTTSAIQPSAFINLECKL